MVYNISVQVIHMTSDPLIKLSKQPTQLPGIRNMNTGEC